MMRGAGCLVKTVADQRALERIRTRVQVDLAKRFGLRRDLEYGAMRAHQLFKNVAADREIVMRIRYANPSTPREVAASAHERRALIGDCARMGCIERVKGNGIRRLSMHRLSRMGRVVPLPNPLKSRRDWTGKGNATSILGACPPVLPAEPDLTGVHSSDVWRRRGSPESPAPRWPPPDN